MLAKRLEGRTNSSDHALVLARTSLRSHVSAKKPIGAYPSQTGKAVADMLVVLSFARDSNVRERRSQRRSISLTM
jgi:hypothetical protein